MTFKCLNLSSYIIKIAGSESTADPSPSQS